MAAKGSMSWATKEQKTYLLYLQRRYKAGDNGHKRLSIEVTLKLEKQLSMLKALWVEDSAHRDMLSELCDQLCLNPETEVSIKYGEAEGEAS